jgi:hypothetical protein
LKIKEYAPGESGEIRIAYSAGSKAGSVNKHLYVYTNDPAGEKVELTVKARVTLKVLHEPEWLNLSLRKGNAGCPDIKLSSTDGKEFSVTRFYADHGCLSVNVDPSKKAKEFILKPKVDMAKLGEKLRGRVMITLTHPECKSVSFAFSAQPEFKTQPAIVSAFNIEPLKAFTREVWVLSNYEENIEVESVSAKTDSVKVLKQEPIANADGVNSRLRLEVEITPPARSGNMRYFADVLTLNLVDGRKIEINCRGYYATKR